MKRTIFWLIPIGILISLCVYYWPQEEITEHEYIDYVKASAYGSITYDELMANNCSEQNWVYFATNRGQDVVEFKGTCTIKDEQQKVNLQFLVDENVTTVELGAMLIANEQVNEQTRNATLETFHS